MRGRGTRECWRQEVVDQYNQNTSGKEDEELGRGDIEMGLLHIHLKGLTVRDFLERAHK